MYWKISKKKGFEALAADPHSVLLAWSGRWGGPQVIGAWRIRKDSFETHDERVSCRAIWEPALQKRLLGLRLAGSGQSYQGPRIFI